MNKYNRASIKIVFLHKNNILDVLFYTPWEDMNYYQQTKHDVLESLSTTEQIGLSTHQVEQLLLTYGKNELKQKAKVSPWVIFLQQFKSPLIVVLLAATLVSALIGDMSWSAIIVIIVMLNAIVGFVQEYKAEQSIESLKKMMSLQSRVIRDGQKITIDSTQLVPGDIVILEEGDKIPADGYLLQMNNLETSESVLTGESLPVKKSLEVIVAQVPLADQYNMVFSGTVVVKWFGTFVVTATGMHTQIGTIATLIDTIEDKTTHLQKKLAQLGKKIWWSVIIICIFVFASYYGWYDMSLSSAFLAAVALAVAAIPEWLPTVVTIALSLWVKRMVKKNALMRKLPAVETLWSVTVICSDKTGTLTKNEMTVKEVYADGKAIHVTGTWYSLNGWFSDSTESLEQLLKIGVLCNHASITSEGKMIGDPTEWCLLVSAKKWWYDRQSYAEYTYIDEIPFDSTRKMMTSIYTYRDNYEVFVKWAVESVLPACNRILDHGVERDLTQEDKTKIIHHNNELADQAMRVLAFAYKKMVAHPDKGTAEIELVFVWLQAIIDPAREEVKDAIQVCHQAGIRVVMITWDNIQTAQAIANKLHITGKAMLWSELEWLSDQELLECIADYGVFARVNPSHKQRLVNMLQKQWHIVAMTWDGVNDAPALKQADIGIAMGITGTDVSKEASDMILLDDNFTTIVAAIEEWRGIYDNIKKFVNFLLSTNFAEVLILFVASMIGIPLPLLAIHILWINLITDGLPALALGVDPIDPRSMARKPEPSHTNIINKKMAISIILISLVISITVIVFFLAWYTVDLPMARTGVLLLLVFLEIMRVQMIRSDYHIGMFSNKRLIGSLLLSVLMVWVVIYTPLSTFFQTKPLSDEMWMDVWIYVGIASIVGLGLDYLVDIIWIKEKKTLIKSL